MSDDIETWVRKVEAWAELVRMRANFPDHPLHMTMYRPLYQWLVDNQPEAIGLLLKKGKRND